MEENLLLDHPIIIYFVLAEPLSPTLVHFYLLQHYKQGQEFTDILMYMNIAFTVLYMIEAALKFFALRLVSFDGSFSVSSCLRYRVGLGAN